MQGTSWRFQAFYAAFRTQVRRTGLLFPISIPQYPLPPLPFHKPPNPVQMSHQLGMQDYAQLSMFSPVVHRRLISPAHPPSAYWALPDGSRSAREGGRGGGGSGGKRGAMHDEWPLGGSSGGGQGTADGGEPAPFFKRTKAKVTAGSLMPPPSRRQPK